MSHKFNQFGWGAGVLILGCCCEHKYFWCVLLKQPSLRRTQQICFCVQSLTLSPSSLFPPTFPLCPGPSHTCFSQTKGENWLLISFKGRRNVCVCVCFKVMVIASTFQHSREVPKQVFFRLFQCFYLWLLVDNVEEGVYMFVCVCVNNLR